MQQDKEIQGILIGKETIKLLLLADAIYIQNLKEQLKKMFICRGKRPRLPNSVSKKKKVGGQTLPDFRT